MVLYSFSWLLNPWVWVRKWDKVYLKTEIHIFALSTEPLLRCNRKARYLGLDMRIVGCIQIHITEHFKLWMTRMILQCSWIIINFCFPCWIKLLVSYKIFPKKMMTLSRKLRHTTKASKTVFITEREGTEPPYFYVFNFL